MPVDPEVADFAAGLSDEYLLCRVEGHAKPTSLRARTAYWDSDLRCYVQTRECPSCGRVVTQHISGTGHIIQTTAPRYPQGYLHTGRGRLEAEDRDALRLEGLIRTTEVTPLARARTRRRAS